MRFRKVYSQIRCSSSAAFGPVVIQPERRTSVTASISRSEMEGRESGRKGCWFTVARGSLSDPDGVILLNGTWPLSILFPVYRALGNDFSEETKNIKVTMPYKHYCCSSNSSARQTTIVKDYIRIITNTYEYLLAKEDYLGAHPYDKRAIICQIGHYLHQWNGISPVGHGRGTPGVHPHVT